MHVDEARRRDQAGAVDDAGAFRTEDARSDFGYSVSVD
jgi:hypothetical protein